MRRIEFRKQDSKEKKLKEIYRSIIGNRLKQDRKLLFMLLRGKK
jgi:hypothetical protein